ncbi:30S ribosomal protein S8 [uncultured archaeon]|nr:30S ribosomal protein S8 [uncultured archaeon]
MRHDIINDAIADIKNHERIGASELTVEPKSKLLMEILRVFAQEGYVESAEPYENNHGGGVKIRLNKKINDCGIVRPRFPVKAAEFSKWEKRFLPSFAVGTLVVSTSNGVMSHREASEKNLGGKLLAYVY